MFSVWFLLAGDVVTGEASDKTYLIITAVGAAAAAVLGGIAAVIGAVTRKDTKKINTAVNNVPAGDPTILQLVQTLSTTVQSVNTKVDHHDARFERVEQKIDSAVDRIDRALSALADRAPVDDVATGPNGPINSRQGR